jgi:hypothetical protein
MARNTQFLQLVTMLREELSRATDVSVGVSDIPSLKRKINRYYEHLYYDADWPHLRKIFDRIALNADQRFYDLPAALDYERIEDVKLYQNGIPIPIERGIASVDYAAWDSTLGQTASPAQKWDIRDVDGDTMFEVWPIPPVSDDQSVEFTGLIKFERLVNDDDVCLLDDNMVVGFAAAELLAKDGAKNAQQVGQSAQGLYDRLRGRARSGSQKIHSFSGSQPSVSRNRVTVRISG